MSFIFTSFCDFSLKRALWEGDMFINYDSINTAADAAKIMNENLRARVAYADRIRNSSVSSKATGKNGTITDVSKKALFLNFEHWNSVPVPVDGYERILEVDQDVKSAIGMYLRTYEDEKKLNRLLLKLSKAGL